MMDLKALRALCDAATDGDWQCHAREADEFITDIGDVFIPPPHEGGFSIHKNCNPVNNARFIAATDPRTVRALIDEIEKYREALEEIFELAAETDDDMVADIAKQALGEIHE